MLYEDIKLVVQSVPFFKIETLLIHLKGDLDQSHLDEYRL